MSVWRSTAQNVNERYDLCKRRGKASLRVEGILKVVCVVRVVVADGGGGQDPRSARASSAIFGGLSRENSLIGSSSKAST